MLFRLGTEIFLNKNHDNTSLRTKVNKRLIYKHQVRGFKIAFGELTSFG